ncbi:MAG TPA: hypothetical protein VD815_03690 [Candidatus Saccharimonadales bacterium]|nr:hypothetical protein [Candidatus Saccharimonadales bacterium]
MGLFDILIISKVKIVGSPQYSHLRLLAGHNGFVHKQSNTSFVSQPPYLLGQLMATKQLSKSIKINYYQHRVADLV